MGTEVEEKEKALAGTPKRATKINWDEARTFYFSDEKTSIADVSEKFQVSYKTVAKWCARQHWYDRRRELIATKGMEADRQLVAESNEEINERHIIAYRQMQQFIQTNMAIAQGYMREKYTEAQKKHKAVDKKEQYSAQNIKYMMEAWKIAIDGERIGLGIATASPSKSEKDIKVSGGLQNYSKQQLEALFVTGAELLDRDMPESKVIDGGTGR